MQDQLGDYLKDLRSNVDLNILSVSKKTKVRSQILEKIENNEKIDRPNIIVKSYVLSFGKAVGADQELLIQKFNEVYPQEIVKKRIPLPSKKNVSNFFIWGVIFLLLLISIGVSISSNTSTVTASVTPRELNNSDTLYSTPKSIQDILSSPSPSSDNNK